jgi:hypothetical protein
MFMISLQDICQNSYLSQREAHANSGVFAARFGKDGCHVSAILLAFPIRRVSDEVSESGGPELLGRIPRRVVGGASSISASPSANPVGRRERGCLQVRTLESVFSVRYDGPLAVPASALAFADASEAGCPKAGAGGTEGDRRCGERARTAPSGVGGGSTAPGRPFSHLVQLGTG